MIFSFLCIPKKPRENCFPKEQKQKAIQSMRLNTFAKGPLYDTG